VSNADAARVLGGNGAWMALVAVHGGGAAFPPCPDPFPFHISAGVLRFARHAVPSHIHITHIPTVVAHITPHALPAPVPMQGAGCTIPNCAKCSADGKTCLECKPLFVLTSGRCTLNTGGGGKRCKIPPTIAPKKCLQCNAQGTACQVCAVGFEPHPTSGDCQPVSAVQPGMHSACQ